MALPLPEPGTMNPALARPAKPKPAKTARPANIAVRRASRTRGRGRLGEASFSLCHEMLRWGSRLLFGNGMTVLGAHMPALGAHDATAVQPIDVS